MTGNIAKGGEVYLLNGTNKKIKIKAVMGEYITFVNINGPRTNCLCSIPYWILAERYTKKDAEIN